jgi:hypothetical protein
VVLPSQLPRHVDVIGLVSAMPTIWPDTWAYTTCHIILWMTNSFLLYCHVSIVQSTNSACWRQHCTDFASFPYLLKISDNFVIQTSFEVLFAQLEISRWALQLGVFFVEFWALWFLRYF